MGGNTFDLLYYNRYLNICMRKVYQGYRLHVLR